MKHSALWWICLAITMGGVIVAVALILRDAPRPSPAIEPERIGHSGGQPGAAPQLMRGVEKIARVHHTTIEVWRFRDGTRICYLSVGGQATGISCVVSP